MDYFLTPSLYYNTLGIQYFMCIRDKMFGNSRRLRHGGSPARSISPASPSPYNQYSEAILPEALKVTFPFSSHALLEADFWRICQISI